ncbi:MAG: hypothetical protein NC416_16025 [Eubacterium sp.]|nr:hypothetical protein [Eubacterium sp.]
MKRRKNKLDEMQEQKMLRIEHNGFWLGFVGLAVAIAIQMICYGPDCRDQIIGEFAVVLCLGVYTMAGCIKNGIWDRRLAPTWKVNLYASLLAGVIAGILRFFIVYREYRTPMSCAAVGVIAAVSTFMITFALMAVCLFLYKQREKQIEEGIAQEQDAEIRHKANREGVK